MASNLNRFVRSVPVDVLKGFFLFYMPQVAGEMDWDQKQGVLRKDLIQKIEGLPSAEQGKVIALADQIDEMTDEAGQAALRSVVKDIEQFSKISGHHARAEWVLRTDPETFRRAESICYVEHKRDNKRIFSGYRVAQNLHPNEDVESVAAFERSISQLASGQRRVQIDQFQRKRKDKDGNEIQVTHYAIYYESLSEMAMVFDKNGGIEPIVFDPARTAALVFDSQAGLIEILYPGHEQRENIARAFAKHILKINSEIDGIKLCEYNLDCLLRPHLFQTDTEDAIASVKLESLCLREVETNNRIVLSLAAREPKTLCEFCQELIHNNSPIYTDLFVSRAVISLRQEPKEGRRRGKLLRLKLSYPNGCSMKDCSESDRYILEKYIKKWELVRDI